MVTFEEEEGTLQLGNTTLHDLGTFVQVRIYAGMHEFNYQRASLNESIAVNLHECSGLYYTYNTYDTLAHRCNM